MADPLRDLVEKDRIVTVVTALFTATDARDWARVRACLAPAVRFDMTSLAGGAPSIPSPSEIAGDAATAACHGIAYHYRKVASGRNTRTFVGSYDFHLVRDGGAWRIDLFRFNSKFLDGNLELDREP